MVVEILETMRLRGKITSLTINISSSSSLKNLSNFIGTQVELLSVVFGDNFDTRNVTDMSGMFTEDKKLPSITFGSRFVTGNVTDMSGMFDYCNAMSSLDISDWDVSSVSNIYRMFRYCFCADGVSNAVLSLPAFKMANFTVTDSMDEVFSGATKLKTIKVPAGTDWSKAGVNGADMFLDCTSLVGGAGSKLSDSDPVVVDKTRALIDNKTGDPSVPGYFTAAD